MPGHHHLSLLDRTTTFRCRRCNAAFRKRADGNAVVRPDRAVCRGCSSSPDARAELKVARRAEEVMARLQSQGAVRGYTVLRNSKVTGAELASVEAHHALPERPLRWDVTVVAKVGATDQPEGLQTQLAHIELDGWQHFRFSSHGKSQEAFCRSAAHDRIKDAVVRRSGTSRYGARFRRVSLLRAALVRPHHRSRDRRQQGRDTRRAIGEAVAAVEPFLTREFSEAGRGSLQLFPPEAYTDAAA